MTQIFCSNIKKTKTKSVSTFFSNLDLRFEHFRKLDSQRLLENNFETTKLQNKSFSILFIHDYLFTLDTACFEITEISVKIV